jgi:hypothetical protein
MEVTYGKKFADLNNLSKKHTKEGLVMLGAGGDIHEWVDGVTTKMISDGIVVKTEDDIWSEIILLVTSGGRIDLAFIMNNDVEFNMGKLAMWRLKFGSCSWVSDYVINYKSDHWGGD